MKTRDLVKVGILLLFTGVYLGNLNSNKFDPNSVSNKYSTYGSTYSPNSINNSYGQYGSKYSNNSVNNPYATNSPIIMGQTNGYPMIFSK